MFYTTITHYYAAITRLLRPLNPLTLVLLINTYVLYDYYALLRAYYAAITRFLYIFTLLLSTVDCKKMKFDDK